MLAVVSSNCSRRGQVFTYREIHDISSQPQELAFPGHLLGKRKSKFVGNLICGYEVPLAHIENEGLVPSK